jgi:hypothetical protein
VAAPFHSAIHLAGVTESISYDLSSRGALLLPDAANLRMPVASWDGSDLRGATSSLTHLFLDAMTIQRIDWAEQLSGVGMGSDSIVVDFGPGRTASILAQRLPTPPACILTDVQSDARLPFTAPTTTDSELLSVLSETVALALGVDISDTGASLGLDSRQALPEDWAVGAAPAAGAPSPGGGWAAAVPVPGPPELFPGPSRMPGVPRRPILPSTSRPMTGGSRSPSVE